MFLRKTLCDHERYYNDINLTSHLYRYIFNPSYRIIWLYRKLNQSKGKSLIHRFLKLYYLRQCNRFMVDLDAKTNIGPGLWFPHGGPITINSATVIGENCIIHPCVLLGGDRKTGAPIIGDNVFVGHGAKIIGHISVGNNVFISPGAVITKDIESDCIMGAGVNNIIRSYGGLEAYRKYAGCNVEI